ncbi:MAG: sigma-70 family RNA polymerase sigma factor [Planctomycetales bacterium]|nr:sigma-70 family RNA polymerase sigma factor [Planctomycetales bacterium]
MATADFVLVDQALQGDRQAFTEIVSRYQTLVCSIAYAITGNLHVSEELAQETFVSAWHALETLHEPTRLRPWLCGIVRNLANDRNRRRSRDVLESAHEIVADQVASSPADDPASTSVAREEEELLDRTLSGLPETYREPLVLFYREQQSVARVAELLDLTPNTVRQRLSRGREMLRNEIVGVVERGLLRSAPGRAFTLGVVAALPIMSTSAKAATVTITTAKGVGAMSSASWLGYVGVLLGPAAGLLGGWFGYTMSMRSARSDAERVFVHQLMRVIVGLIVASSVALGTLITFGEQWRATHPSALVAAIVVTAISYVIALGGTVLWANVKIARIRRETGTVRSLSQDEVAARLPAVMRTLQYTRSYDSPWRLLGVPLISVRFHGASAYGQRQLQPAVGWIAIGDKAYGILFACGSIAVGGFAFGAVSIGLLAFGGLGIGAVALGGAAVGYWTAGGIGIGWYTFAGVALAGKAAIGGVAVARDFALGGIPLAAEANTDAAKAFIETSSFFHWAGMLMSPWGWFAAVAVILLPMFIALRFVSPKSESLRVGAE